MTATTTALVDQRVGITFASQGDSPTKWIEVTYPTDNPPTAMFDRLAQIGFEQSEDTITLPPVRATSYNENAPIGERLVDLGYYEQTIHLTKRGTGLFSDWTDEEARENMRQARAVLRSFGFIRVPVWKKTLADML